MMKKHMFVIGILIIAFIFGLSGCTEQTKKNEISTNPQTVSQVLFQQDTYLNKEITVIGSYLPNFGNCSHLLIDAYAGLAIDESGEEYHLMLCAEEDDFNKLRKIYDEEVLNAPKKEYEKSSFGAN